MVQLIHSQPRAWSRGRLAHEFELSERMIDNDLQLIRHGLRYDLRRSPTGYYFADGPVLATIHLSVPEALGLALAAQLARDTGTVDGGTIAAALARLEDALPAGIVPYLRRAGSEGSLSPFHPARERGATLTTLEQGWAERRKVSIAYASASRGGVVTDRTVAPYYLLPYERSWLLIAHDSLRDEARMFKVDRIRRCELTDARFEIPADFDVPSYLGGTWGVLRGQSGPIEHVELRFGPLAAAWVRDEVWHPSQEIEMLADGGLVIRFHCSVTNELVRWVLSFGGEVGVEEPVGLREAVRQEAERVVAGTERELSDG